MINTFIIDRFEAEQWAVLEDSDGRTFSLPASWLPGGAREGDVLRITRAPAGAASGEAMLRIVVDDAARANRESDIATLRERLPRGPAGDLDL